jgi:probable F420-dependent oxidoreductase
MRNAEIPRDVGLAAPPRRRTLSHMLRLGIVLPHIGPLAGPEAIVDVARGAEVLGYDSLWVTDRLLYPLQPRTPYPPTADGSLPDAYRRVLDPLVALSLAAAHTRTIGLGMSVLDMPFYNPVLLARSLTALDVISGGRLKVGLGLGWSADEFEAAGASMRARGRRADEFLGVLKAVWGPDPVSFEGEFYRVAPSIVGAKPVQQPHPPLYLAAYAPGALRRAARLADGWNPAGVPLQGMARGLAALRAMALAAGREPSAVNLVVRANVHLTDAPSGPSRPLFTGSLQEVADDVGACQELGAAELFFDLTFTPQGTTREGLFTSMERLYEATRSLLRQNSGRGRMEAAVATGGLATARRS